MKKALPLAGMMVMLVVLAVPAVASAENYRLYDVPENETISEHTAINLSGIKKFETLGTGIECTVHATLTTADGVNAQVSAFQVTTSSCVGFGFLYAGCKLTGDTVDNLPWELHVNASTLTATNLLFTETYSNCSGGITFINFEYKDLTLTVDNVNGITKATLSGVGTGTNNFGTFSTAISGSLSVVGGDAGTYGLETY